MLRAAQGTNARNKVSVWAPADNGHILFRRNRMRVCLGHYAALDYGKPESNKPPGSIKANTLELTDLQVRVCCALLVTLRR